MSALAWLAIPVVGLLLGVLWALWSSRPRPPAGTHETVEEHERFKAAFESTRREQPPRRRWKGSD
jgi:hypothetical protein